MTVILKTENLNKSYQLGGFINRVKINALDSAPDYSYARDGQHPTYEIELPGRPYLALRVFR